MKSRPLDDPDSPPFMILVETSTIESSG